ncbi:efflux RND transporter permease subunit [Arcicella aquatica]|uniref:Efflux RND transporter permease subunit n=1 Tax=Arcicella aquatica TaxID=217141 RepID=A0ABU5QHM8_9BACT|nr:efflux RND transporter permease subunit [Arcicella aquatica]MEA5256557.1 efflux RND transporter permease subunit [Arcicella aquatica]
MLQETKAPKSSYGILIAFVVLSIIGFALIPKLSVQLNPSNSSGSINVSYYWGNVSPEVLERQVTAKLEGAFSTLQGIKKLSSISSYGNGYITLEIDKSANLDQLRFEVATLIRQLYPQLPKEVSYPIINLNSPNQETQQKPLMSLQFNGQTSLSDLKVYAEEQLKPKLAQIKGIYNVNVYGGNRQEWVLTYDRLQLESLQITESQIVNAIKNQYQQSSLGLVRTKDGQQMNVVLTPKSSHYLTHKSADEIVKELENIALSIRVKDSQKVDRIIHLSDILKVSRNERPIEEFYRINGKNAVTIVIQADLGANQLTLAKNIRAKLTKISKTLPPTYQTNIEYDATEYIRENLDKIWVQSGLAILILLIFVWLTTRSWAYTMLIVLSLTVNLAISFIVFYFLNIEIHLYSLAAITTSLGILIDNTIVMIDHYRRYRNLSVFTALLGATLTTIAGLMVIWFLPEETKIDLLDFAIVMIITLGISLLVALFFVPAMIERLNIRIESKGITKTNKLKRIAKLSKIYSVLVLFFLRFRKTAFVLMILAFGLPVFMLPNRLEATKPYAEFYNATIGSENYQENIQPIINKVFGGSLRLFANYVYEKSYYSKNERTSLYVNAGLPNQSTIEQMNDLYLRVENYLGQFKEIDRFITRIYNGQNGSMTIYFKPQYENSSFPYILKNRMIALSTEMSGINWDIYGVGQGFSQNLDANSTPTFNVLMKGYNYNELERQANILKQRLETHPRIQEVNINNSFNFWNNKSLYEFVLQTEPKHLALYGRTNAEVYDYLQRQNVRSNPDIYQLMNGEYEQIKVVPVDSKTFDVWSLMNQKVNIDKNVIKLSSFTRTEKQKVSPEINKENQEYLRMISFEYFGSQTFGDKFLEQTLKEIKTQLPLGYTAKKQGYNWFGEEAKQQYWLLGLVIVLIYIICAIIFESLLQPIALILQIPISFIGVFLTFYWFDFNFDQGGYASFVLLSGNVVCAAIFIISEFNNLRRLHPYTSDFKLYIKAFNHKIIPILLTVLSTVVGLIPFLIYGQNEAFWFALGVGTIGGLIISLIGIIFYLPLFLKFNSNDNMISTHH